MFLESLVRLEAVCARAHIEQAEYALRVRLICAQMFFWEKLAVKAARASAPRVDKLFAISTQSQITWNNCG